MQMYVCRTLGHPESMIVYCVFLCSGRHSCRVQVVYRAVAYLSSMQKKKTPFEPNAPSLLFKNSAWLTNN